MKIAPIARIFFKTHVLNEFFDFIARLFNIEEVSFEIVVHIFAPYLDSDFF